MADGKLTQEQADLILSYYKEQESLRNGACPSCGYQFRSGAGFGKGGRGRGGKGGRGGMRGFDRQNGAGQDSGAANGAAYTQDWSGVQMNAAPLEGV